MISMDGILGIVFLFQTGLGVMGNALLFVSYAHMFTVSIKQRPISLIITHLSLVNMLLVCATGISEEAAVLGLSSLINDIVCKTNIYIHRVSHGLSICLKSLLSITQAITINPTNSYWATCKTRNLLYILYSFVFVWILNLLISFNLIISITALKNMTLSRVIVQPCFILTMGDLIRCLFLTFMTLRDVSFLGSMCWMSGYMTIHLYTHHKQTQHLPRSGLHFKMSPEMTASKKIIILTLCFNSLYGLDMMVSFSLGYFSKHKYVLLNAKKFIGGSFALLSPMVLLSNSNQFYRFLASLRKRRNDGQKDDEVQR